MATFVNDKQIEHQLEDLGKRLTVPVKRSTLATAIVRKVLTAKSVDELVTFVRDLRPDFHDRNAA